MDNLDSLTDPAYFTPRLATVVSMSCNVSNLYSPLIKNVQFWYLLYLLYDNHFLFEPITPFKIYLIYHYYNELHTQPTKQHTALCFDRGQAEQNC